MRAACVRAARVTGRAGAGGRQVLLECGHGGLCAGCAGRLWKQPRGGRACPLCRRDFAGVVRIRDPAAHPVRTPRTRTQAQRALAHGERVCGALLLLPLPPPPPPPPFTPPLIPALPAAATAADFVAAAAVHFQTRA